MFLSADVDCVVYITLFAAMLISNPADYKVRSVIQFLTEK